MKDGLERFPHFCVLVKNLRPEFVPFLLGSRRVPRVSLCEASSRPGRPFSGMGPGGKHVSSTGNDPLSLVYLGVVDGNDRRVNRFFLQPHVSVMITCESMESIGTLPSCAYFTIEKHRRHEWRKYLSPWKGREHARLYLVQTPPKDRLEFPVSQVRHISPTHTIYITEPHVYRFLIMRVCPSRTSSTSSPSNTIVQKSTLQPNAYSKTRVTRPVATVRPPSRTLKR